MEHACSYDKSRNPFVNQVFGFRAVNKVERDHDKQRSQSLRESGLWFL